MSEEREPFLERWSRLKTKDREVANEPYVAPPPAPPVKAEEAPQLPKIEELTPESDFRPFMNANVDPGKRREALKKLFADAHFNTPDPFEPFSADLTGEDPIPPELLKTLNQAKKFLFDEHEKTAAVPADEKTEPPAADAKDAAASKDA
jgi:hypothetical protein